MKWLLVCVVVALTFGGVARAACADVVEATRRYFDCYESTDAFLSAHQHLTLLKKNGQARELEVLQNREAIDKLFNFVHIEFRFRSITKDADNADNAAVVFLEHYASPKDGSVPPVSALKAGIYTFDDACRLIAIEEIVNPDEQEEVDAVYAAAFFAPSDKDEL